MQSYPCVNYSGVSNALASAYTCVSKRARARRVGVRGSLARNKARTNNRALAASLFPPQKNKAAIDRASTFCLCEFVHSPAGKKIKSNVRAATSVTGMEGSVKNKIVEWP